MDRGKGLFVKHTPGSTKHALMASSTSRQYRVPTQPHWELTIEQNLSLFAERVRRTIQQPPYSSCLPPHPRIATLAHGAIRTSEPAAPNIATPQPPLPLRQYLSHLRPSGTFTLRNGIQAVQRVILAICAPACRNSCARWTHCGFGSTIKHYISSKRTVCRDTCVLSSTLIRLRSSVPGGLNPRPRAVRWVSR
jgi:hypothetical protein